MDVANRLVTGITGSKDSRLSQEMSSLTFVSCGANIPAVVYASVNPDNIMERDYLTGENGPNRLIVKLPAQVDFQISPNPKARFLQHLKSLKSKPNSSSLVIIITGHGGKIFLLSAACFSGNWDSEKWSLLTAAKAGNDSFFFSESNSGELRGALDDYAALGKSLQQSGVAVHTDKPHSSQEPNQAPVPILSSSHQIPETVAAMNQIISDYPHSRTEFSGSTNTQQSVPLADISDQLLDLLRVYQPASIPRTSISLPALPPISLTSSASSIQQTAGGMSHSATLPEFDVVKDHDFVQDFLLNRHRLATNASNVSLIMFIRQSADDSSLRSAAEQVLKGREEKRNRARKFVLLMNWASGDSDEGAGIGTTDAAMDYDSGQAGALGLNAASGTNSQLLDAIVPEITINRTPVRFWEPLAWAARHWDRAKRPKMDSQHVLYMLKRAGLLKEQDTTLALLTTISPFEQSDVRDIVGI
ncbi:hypothetical protein C8J56DRAFT_335831 [Mycena floridula]|nr:hypothetical protein C8J56DRAFT_335831 [Mycena floridula]